MSELTFLADMETLKILEKVGLDKKDDFINRAVKAYATGGGAFEYASGGANSGSALSLSAGLTAGLGGTSASLSSLSPGGATGGVVSSDPVSQLNAELERLLGAGSGVAATLVAGNPQMVEFFQSGSKIARLELSECQSILKSLRPPISLSEVVEMLTLMSVG